MPKQTTPVKTTRKRNYVSPDQAAEIYGVSGRTIRNMIARGDVTGYRLGPKLIRVDLDELEETVRIIPSAQHNA